MIEKQTLIENLNKDLAEELAAVIQYVTYAAKVSGPYRPQLKGFFEQEIPDELGHAQFLANKIVQLGGEPTTLPSILPEANDNKAMLQAVLEAETRAITAYLGRIEQAEQIGEKGLALKLEDMVVDETGHRDECQRMLDDWPL